MRWIVIVAKPAQKQAAKFPTKDRSRVGSAIASMAADPFSGDVLKLEGQGNRWRRRVGSYRIFFAVDNAAKTVAISAILRRTSSTY